MTDAQWTPNTAIGPTYGVSNGATNPQGVTGYYYTSDPNLNFIINEWYILSQLPAAMVKPLVPLRSIWCAPNSVVQTNFTLELAGIGHQVGGLTVACNPHQAGISICETVSMVGSGGPGTTPVGSTGTLIHEWGHCIDNQYMYKYGVVNGNQFARSQQSDIQAIWTAVTQLSGYTNNGSVFYGWVNVLEFVAETFCFHMLGSHGLNLTNAVFGNPVTKTPDQMFKGMIMGTANINAPDDANTTAMHSIIAAYAPPFPSPPPLLT